MTGTTTTDQPSEPADSDAAAELLRDHLDEHDFRIFKALNQDGRMSDTELADRVGLSRTAVRRRRENLLESGILEVLAVIVLQEADLAYADVRVSLNKSATSEARDKLITRLVNADLVYSVDTYMGEYDLFVRTWHESLNGVKTYVWDLLDGKEAVEDYEITPIVKTWKAWNRKLNEPAD